MCTLRPQPAPDHPRTSRGAAVQTRQPSLIRPGDPGPAGFDAGECVKVALVGVGQDVQGVPVSLECFLDYLTGHGTSNAKRQPDHFHRKQLKGWLAWIAGERGYAPATIVLRLGTVKAFLAHCAAEDITPPDLRKQDRRGSSRPVLGLDSSNFTLLRHFGPTTPWGWDESNARRRGLGTRDTHTETWSGHAIVGRERLWANDPEVSVVRGQRCIELTTPVLVG